MNPAPPVDWSWRRWTGWTGLVLAMHIGLLLVIPPAPKGAGTPSLEIPARIVAGNPHSGDIVARFTDPTLLALPHEHDFSASAWLRPQAPPHRFAEWVEPARWLAADSSQLGLLPAISVGRPAYDPPALSLPHPLNPATVSPNPPPRPSRLVVEGLLAATPPLSLPVLPQLTATNLVTNSIVIVLANQNGHVLTARLPAADPQRPREQIDADNLALGLSRSLRFPPSPPSWREGRLVFQWSVQPPAGGTP